MTMKENEKVIREGHHPEVSTNAPALTLSSRVRETTAEREKATCIPTMHKGLDDLYSKKEWTLFVSLCPSLFILGWNDGSIGPLLPRIQATYGLNYVLASLIFLGATAGFLIGALLNIYGCRKIPTGIMLTTGAIVSIIGFALEVSQPPFPVFVMAWAINIIGLSIQDAQANAIVTSLQRKPALKTNLFQTIYSLGALTSPLVATQLASRQRWSFHFLTGMGMMVFNAILVASILRFKRLDAVLLEAGIQPQNAESEREETEKNSLFTGIFSLPEVHLLTAILFLYAGVAVTVGGWIVEYLQRVKGGGNAAGYGPAGFYGDNAVQYSLRLQCVVWFVPSLIGTSVAEAFVGFFLAPVFPIVMQLCGLLVLRDMLSGAIGWIAGVGGTSGSAVFPFITGIVASAKGISVLQPIVVALITTLFMLWITVPIKSKIRTNNHQMS
ncbi:MFS general substrate transporter [Serendipita vermifera]|nr:MFS general substrate transporter [Serendipita vermifera]